MSGIVGDCERLGRVTALPAEGFAKRNVFRADGTFAGQEKLEPVPEPP